MNKDINAIDMVRQMVTDGQVSQEVAEKYFPELKEESENERMKEMAIKAIYAPEAQSCIKSWGVNPDDVIAWLEKQGEHAKFRDSIQVGDKVTRNQDGMLVNLSQLNRVAKKDEKQGEQKDILEDAVLDSNKDGLIADTIRCKREKQGGQKPAEWSEEDETALGDALWCCKKAASIAKDENDMGNVWYAENWLKSIKDRVQPQPKQEWYKEAENNILFLTSIIEECFKDKEEITLCGDTVCANFTKGNVIDRLKSLRPQNWTKEDKDRYISCLQRLSTGNPEQPETINSKWFKEHVYPQKKWKPSDKQLEAVRIAAEIGTANDSWAMGILKGMYQDLKKLREE